MGLIELLLVICVIGLIAYVLVRVIPMPEPFPKIVVAVAAIVALIIVLRALGFDASIPKVR